MSVWAGLIGGALICSLGIVTVRWRIAVRERNRLVKHLRALTAAIHEGAADELEEIRSMPLDALLDDVLGPRPGDT